jgi:hypothetical protein
MGELRKMLSARIGEGSVIARTRRMQAGIETGVLCMLAAKNG